MTKNHAAVILSALRNYVFRDKDIESLAKARALICGGCEYFSMDGYKHCTICKCSIPLKIRSVEQNRSHECPKNYWKELDNLTENIIKKLYANQ